MGIWYYKFEKDNNNDLINSIYWISLFVNLMFVPILFSLNNLVLALIDVIVLFAMILFLFIYSLKQKQKYAFLLLPYLIWLVLACTLMIDLILCN